VSAKIEVTQTLPVVAVRVPPPAVPEAAVFVEPPKESGFSRLLGRIPLLRRLRKHPSQDESESP
jgi:hypothetical protein